MGGVTPGILLVTWGVFCLLSHVSDEKKKHLFNVFRTYIKSIHFTAFSDPAAISCDIQITDGKVAEYDSSGIQRSDGVSQLDEYSSFVREQGWASIGSAI